MSRLDEAERDLRLILDNSADVLIGYDRDRRVRWASPSLATTFGWNPAEVIGTPFRLAAAEERERIDEALNAALRERRSVVSLRTRVRCADGSSRWGEATTRLVWTPSGQLDFYVVNMRDISAQVAAEHALAAREQLFRRAMADAAIGVCLLGPDGRFLAVNQSLCRLLGYEEDDLLARDWATLAHPEDRDVDLFNARRLMEGEIDRLRVTTRFLRSDGQTIVVDASVSGIRDDDGRVATVVGQLVDITEHTHTEKALAESEEHFRLLAENSADVVLRLADHGTIRWVSQSVTNVLGWPTSDVVGQPVEEFVHPDDLPRFREAIEAPGDWQRRFTVRLCCHDGSHLWFATIATPVLDRGGVPVGRVVALRNVDAEHRATQALALSEQRFRLALESAPTGMAVVDLDRQFVEVNPALARMVGRDANWLTAHRVPDILPPPDQPVDLRMRALILSGRVSSAVEEHRLVRSDGSLLWVQHSIGLLREEDGTPMSYVSQFVDVTEARKARRDLEFLATHDTLTRLANRRALVEQMERVLAHPPRGGARLAVLFLDLDGLKPVNDSMGHAAGDRIIVAVSDRIRGQVRAGDLVARFGGDEWVVLLPEVASWASAQSVAEKIRRVVSEPIVLDDVTVAVTVSVGGALAEPGDSPDDILRRADAAVYRAKAAGGDRVVGQVAGAAGSPVVSTDGLGDAAIHGDAR